MTQERLAAIDARIERVVTDPETVSAPWVRLARPILARLGLQADVKVVATEMLLQQLRALGERAATDEEREELAKQLAIAIDELETNTRSVERVCVLRRRAQVAHGAWLRHLSDAVHAASTAYDRLEQIEWRRIAGAIEPVSLLPPLAIRRQEDGTTAEETGAKDADAKGDDHARRVLELQLGSVDHLLAAARDESEVLSRRRRLLEAARQILIESAAALPVDPAGLEARRAYIAREITLLDRVQAAGVAPDVALVHQARGAIAQGEADRLAAILTLLDRAALARGDAERAKRTHCALAALWRDRDARGPEEVRRSLGASAREMLGAGVLEAIASGYERGRAYYATPRTDWNKDDREFQAAALRYLGHGAESQTLASALMVDGCFEVGGSLAPVRVVEEHQRLEAVRYPTQRLQLVQATEVIDLKDAVIDDPRSLLLQLASGRLLARRFVSERVTRTQRTVMQGEVRVYVLDGSGSMIGPRARVRDAIVVGELATLARRLEEFGKSARVVMFYRYFNESLGPVTRVDTAAFALEAIRDVISTARRGGTDIHSALLASFAQVRAAQQLDPDLARAQIVLVTDGEAPVDEAAIQAARDELGDLAVNVSVIALGQENTALQSLVAKQRARGERAFYHFIPDAALGRMVEGGGDEAPAIHLPPGAVKGKTTSQRAEALASMVGTLVEDIAALGKKHDVEALEALDSEARARREVGLDDKVDLSEGERAKAEALAAAALAKAAADAKAAAKLAAKAAERAAAKAAVPARGAGGRAAA
ncbi:MAG: vWA domain-containing protein, partial [Deltaproteobacteria bacterium]